MKDRNQLYTRWLEHRRRISAPETFSTDVMRAIHRTPAQPESQPQHGLHSYLNHAWVRWMTASGLVLLGLLRILYVAGCLFRTNLVMP